MSVFAQLAVATAMVLLAILVHLTGLAGFLRPIRHSHDQGAPLAAYREIAGIVVAAVGLSILHVAEIWASAARYLLSVTAADFETALYFSTSSYTMIGYGDIVLPRAWGLAGAIEGAHGIILLGWPAALFVAMVGRIPLVETVLKHKR
jgi:hypothetical protein